MDDPVIRPITAHRRRGTGGRVHGTGRRSPVRIAGVVALAGVMLAGLETAAWALETTYLSGQASASGFPVGSPIYRLGDAGMGPEPDRHDHLQAVRTQQPELCVGTGAHHLHRGVGKPVLRVVQVHLHDAGRLPLDRHLQR